MNYQNCEIQEIKRFIARAYKYLKKIGEGHHGRVHLIQKLDDDTKWVIKAIPVYNIKPNMIEIYKKEYELLGRLVHKNIVKQVSGNHVGNYIFIILEYVDGGDLAQKIKQYQTNNKEFEENQILDWTLQLCLGLLQLYKKDIKPSNIFLTRDNVIKIGDFGVSKDLDRTNGKLDSFIGTPYYISPEIINNQPYSYSTDIWSMGILLYQLTCLKLPFHSRYEPAIYHQVINNPYPQISQKYSKDLKCLISKMLIKDYQQRITLQKIFEEPIIKNRLKVFYNITHQQRLLPRLQLPPLSRTAQNQVIQNNINQIQSNRQSGSRDRQNQQSINNQGQFNFQNTNNQQRQNGISKQPESSLEKHQKFQKYLENISQQQQHIQPQTTRNVRPPSTTTSFETNDTSHTLVSEASTRIIRKNTNDNLDTSPVKQNILRRFTHNIIQPQQLINNQSQKLIKNQPQQANIMKTVFTQPNEQEKQHEHILSQAIPRLDSKNKKQIQKDQQEKKNQNFYFPQKANVVIKTEEDQKRIKMESNEQKIIQKNKQHEDTLSLDTPGFHRQPRGQALKDLIEKQKQIQHSQKKAEEILQKRGDQNAKESIQQKDGQKATNNMKEIKQTQNKSHEDMLSLDTPGFRSYSKGKTQKDLIEKQNQIKHLPKKAEEIHYQNEDTQKTDSFGSKSAQKKQHEDTLSLDTPGFDSQTKQVFKDLQEKQNKIEHFPKKAEEIVDRNKTEDKQKQTQTDQKTIKQLQFDHNIDTMNLGTPGFDEQKEKNYINNGFQQQQNNLQNTLKLEQLKDMNKEKNEIQKDQNNKNKFNQNDPLLEDIKCLGTPGCDSPIKRNISKEVIQNQNDLQTTVNNLELERKIKQNQQAQNNNKQQDQEYPSVTIDNYQYKKIQAKTISKSKYQQQSIQKQNINQQQQQQQKFQSQQNYQLPETPIKKLNFEQFNNDDKQQQTNKDNNKFYQETNHDHDISEANNNNYQNAELENMNDLNEQKNQKSDQKQVNLHDNLKRIKGQQIMCKLNQDLIENGNQLNSTKSLNNLKRPQRQFGKYQIQKKLEENALNTEKDNQQQQTNSSQKQFNFFRQSKKNIQPIVEEVEHKVEFQEGYSLNDSLNSRDDEYTSTIKSLIRGENTVFNQIQNNIFNNDDEEQEEEKDQLDQQLNEEIYLGYQNDQFKDNQEEQQQQQNEYNFQLKKNFSILQIHKQAQNLEVNQRNDICDDNLYYNF